MCKHCSGVYTCKARLYKHMLRNGKCKKLREKYEEFKLNIIKDIDKNINLNSNFDKTIKIEEDKTKQLKLQIE